MCELLKREKAEAERKRGNIRGVSILQHFSSQVNENQIQKPKVFLN